MERESSLAVRALAADGTTVLLLAGYLPPTDRYSTIIDHFPGNNVYGHWGQGGLFYCTVEVFENGISIGKGESAVVDEKGTVHVDVGAIAERTGRAVEGYYVVEYHHAEGIPIELYAFHVHKETGTYVSCNVVSYLGDTIYLRAHTDEMENTQFWPGLILDEVSESRLLIINPYNVAMGFQAHLIASDGTVARSALTRLKRRSVAQYPVAGLFPGMEEAMRRNNAGYSLCVSSQYKLIAYMRVESLQGNIMSMMDHLHRFCLK